MPPTASAAEQAAAPNGEQRPVEHEESDSPADSDGESEIELHMKKREALAQHLAFLRKHKRVKWVPFRHGGLSDETFKVFVTRIAAKLRAMQRAQ